MYQMNRYLLKLANEAERKVDHGQDFRDAGVASALSTAAGLAGVKIVSRSKRISASNLLTAGIMGGAGLTADLAAVKINKALERERTRKG